MTLSRPRPTLETLAVHAGYTPDTLTGAVMPPIVLSTTFRQPEPGKKLRYEYSRSGNPTRENLESALAALEGGRFGFAFASGSAATLTLLHTLRPGDHVVSGDDVYGGTFRLLEHVAAPLGISSSYPDLTDPDRLLDALTPSTRLVWIETPSNPTLKIFDIEKLASITRKRGVRLAVDNTFASPILQRPLSLGADVVVHSTTKYINGHSDVVGGAMVTDDAELGERLGFLQNALGAVPSPLDCYLSLRGLRTLALRMQKHVDSARELAIRLERHPAVTRVLYPGLPGHPGHEVARRQMDGPGGMVTVELAGGLEAARRFLGSLELFTLAESLGGVESLAEHPALMTHASMPPEQRRLAGVSDGLVRLSVGVEGLEDLWRDLEAALSGLV